MKNKEILSQLKKQLKHVEYYNEMSPFPIYDTEYVNKIREVMEGLDTTETNYDDLPVVACKNCKSLHVVVDEEENSICMRCNSINELVEFPNIYEYKKEKNIWNED